MKRLICKAKRYMGVSSDSYSNTSSLMAGVRSKTLRGKLTGGAGKGKEQEENHIQAPPQDRKEEGNGGLRPGTDQRGKGKGREALVPAAGGLVLEHLQQEPAVLRSLQAWWAGNGAAGESMLS